MFRIDVRSNVRDVTRSLDRFIREQIPFATAQAINGVAKKVREAERLNMQKVFDGPTPFTMNAVGVKLANKRTLEAVVYVKDKTAEYLEPYEVGGLNKLNSKALLKPVEQKVNQYGNLPARTLSRLKASKKVFVGKVKTKGGVVNGFWQRTKATRGKRAGLKLLIKFEDAHEAKQRLNYRAVAKRTVDATFKREFELAMQKALQTARK
ncbi:hypothetical protein WT88_29510 [Burkholderia stagnalis]|nr:hypothetical protein WT35_04450 [Burkholderia stagnalis]KWN32844.1 hypothetical protein WT86_18575 [Burkholderia stagnalis]KWN44671.1 hypothetical protein WT88_29510 [Burkholderia stagnalis]KWN54404.1 hypothetical protein WT87_03605 [Burkholderia stagnalis]KWO68811.1 hypothetical protein WT99_20975 [Burkholderia stagnalis]